MNTKVKVWDALLRLFHWSLLAAIVVSYLAIDVFNNVEIHVISGIVISALLVFRILWGIVGSNTAKFSSFIPTPKKVLAYIKSPLKDKKNTIGHSALAALSVFALLTSLLVQAVSGLIILHILAIGYYLFKNKINLITPMVSGNKTVDPTSEAAAFKLKTPGWIIKIIVLIISIGAGVFLYINV